MPSMTLLSHMTIANIAKQLNIPSANIEKELLENINNLGIGPQGLGGRFTALAVLIETYPCHITAIPVAVNIQCHACRRATIVI